MLKVGKSFFGIIAGLIFLTVGLVHAFNGFGAFDITYGTWALPSWFAWLVVLVTFIMALVSFKNLK